MSFNSVICIFVDFHLPFDLHSPFSESNMQFPLQPWLSELFFEFGQYLQLGYNISPPQDTVTKYQGSVDFDRSLY